MKRVTYQTKRLEPKQQKITPKKFKKWAKETGAHWVGQEYPFDNHLFAVFMNPKGIVGTRQAAIAVFTDGDVCFGSVNQECENFIMNSHVFHMEDLEFFCEIIEAVQIQWNN